MPGFSLCCHKLDPQQLLVNFQNRRNNHRHGEILLHKRIIQIQFFLDVLPIIVPVIPDVEFPIESKAFLFMFLLFHGEQNFALFETNGAQFLLEVAKEL